MANSYMTKQLMAESLKKLMEKTPFNKISIQNIVDGCGVTRQAFYYHFQDVYQLLGWIYNNEAVYYLEQNKSYSTWKEGYLEAFKYIEQNKAFCINTLHSIGRDHLERFLFSNTSNSLKKIIDEISEGINVPESYKKFIIDFYTPAFIALVGKWMEEDMKEKPETIIADVGFLVDGTIRQAMLRYEEEHR
ncbi:TetR/AcrR family transcriptional regulator C-terminal domain-containing protein [Clostridium sp. C8-1-8]|uniref:TetR/AcrR family transcriptional regulator C-terminal domain-containing protein n=1 Tax=Clostridium sp. C8-1-8 TaxID=2698831 RepID=UPI0013720042|nr:TetR/AcrR family transcriptional regulator C-terminal domain-containing protein [Clostridium sp. C8-1-8]